MKEAFHETNLSAERRIMLQRIQDVARDYAAQGYTLTVRQLYYQLVARDIIENTMRSYKRTADLIAEARMIGELDWNYIEDRGRTTSFDSCWSSPAEILNAVALQFRIDKWVTQPTHIEVMVEKQALEGILEPVCSELQVRFSANKGYSSVSALYFMGKRLARMLNKDKDVVIFYLGDHDPSGIDMTRDVEERLRTFARSQRIQVIRLALNMEQVEEYNPPENPAKTTDSRAADYIKKYGESSWELDALEPRVLADLVRDNVLQYRDVDKWDDALEREHKMKAQLQKYAKAEEKRWKDTRGEDD